MRKIHEIIIHYSASRDDDEEVDFVEIFKWHTEGNKWQDIGYQYLIEEWDDFPLIMVGRPVSIMGAHAKGANLHSIGICLVGNNEGNFSHAVMVRLRELVDDLRKTYKISRRKVFGHQERGTTVTQCPGRELMLWIESYRNKGSCS